MDFKKKFAMKKLFFFIFIIAHLCCTNAHKEKHQGKRNNIINIKNNIKEIKIKDILCNRICDVYIMNDYFFIIDYKSYDKQLHIFNKKNFHYIISTAPIGQGPGEITRISDLITDENHRQFYVKDNGKRKIFRYKLDSVLTNPAYLPEMAMDINKSEYPNESQFINDTLLIGLIMQPTGVSGFQQYTGKWDFNTGKIKRIKDLHPEIEKKRYSMAVSLEQGIFVECFHHHDLMSIRKLDGELIYDIYGQHWDTKTSNKSLYYDNVIFCRDKIIAFYVEGDNFYTDKKGKLHGVWPTKLIIFDSNGEYIKTLETNRNLGSFCYDEENNRLILTMDDEIQFGYLDLDGLID